MHTTLTVGANFALQAMAAVALVVAWWFSDPIRIWAWAASFVLGGLAGRLQAQVIWRSPGEFRSATSSSAIRSLLMKTPRGRWSIALLWLNAALLLASAVTAEASIHPGNALAMGAAFLLARELFCLPAIRALHAPNP